MSSYTCWQILFRFRDPDEPSRTHIHGNIQNGLEYDFELPPAHTDTLIGKATEDHWWVKARMTPRHSGDSVVPVSWLCSVVPCSGLSVNRVASSDDEDSPAPRDEDVYLVCLSKGRDVFNSLERGSEIRGRMR